MIISRKANPCQMEEAFFTPWVLRIPQVYLIASIILCGLVSLPLQWVHNRGLKVSKEKAR